MAYQLRVPAALPEDPRSTPSVYMSTLGSLTPVQESLSLCGRLDAGGVGECKPGLILLSGNRVAPVRVLWSERPERRHSDQNAATVSEALLEPVFCCFRFPNKFKKKNV